MSVTNRFDKLAQPSPGSPGVVAYLTAGDGGLTKTIEAMLGAEDGGASAIELGVPHTDPVADGPVLQAAAARSLGAGFRSRDLVACLEGYRSQGGSLPIALIGYANVLTEPSAGIDLAALAAAGADALAIPDLPLEEAGEVISRAAEVGMTMVFFVAPNTSEARLAAAAQASTAFLYAVARRGTTGSTTVIDAELESYLARARRAAGNKPLAVGFGFSRSEQVRALRGHGDHAVVGTAFVRALEGIPAPQARASARDFICSLLSDSSIASPS